MTKIKILRNAKEDKLELKQPVRNDWLLCFEIYRKFGSGSSLNDIVLERTTVHISDDKGRIAMLELRNTDYDADDCEDVLTRYIYSNHLQSATLELDGEGEIITYEERRSPHEHKNAINTKRIIPSLWHYCLPSQER